MLEKFYMLMNINLKELNHKDNILKEKLVLLNIHMLKIKDKSCWLSN